MEEVSWRIAICSRIPVHDTATDDVRRAVGSPPRAQRVIRGRMVPGAIFLYDDVCQNEDTICITRKSTNDPHGSVVDGGSEQV